MAGPNQSEKDAIDIGLSVPSPEKPPDPRIKSNETARTRLPVGERVGKRLLPIPIPTPMTQPVAHAPESSGLINETARVSDMPDSPAAQMKKVEPPVAMPDIAVQNPLIPAAPAEKNPMLLMWILLGVSALILIIQIWTYFS